MAKKPPSVLGSAPPSPKAWWDDNSHAESAMQAIRDAGHQVHLRRPYDGFAGLVGIVYKDTTLKRPGDYTDLDLFNLSELTDFAQLGKDEFLRSRKLAEYKRLARVFVVQMQDGTFETFDDLSEMRRALYRLFFDAGQKRAVQVSVRNPFTDEQLPALRIIYGIWEWGGEERPVVCVRPAEENPLRLPSCWVRTL